MPADLAKRNEVLAAEMAARRPVPCICPTELATSIDDVADVRDRAGLTVTLLDCRTCGRRWTRIG